MATPAPTTAARAALFAAVREGRYRVDLRTLAEGLLRAACGARIGGPPDRETEGRKSRGTGPRAALPGQEPTGD